MLPPIDGDRAVTRVASPEGWSGAAAAALPAGLLVLDAEGRVVWANRGAADILGWSLEALRRGGVADVLAALPELLDAGAAPGAARRQLATRRGDGRTIVVGYSITPLDEDAPGAPYRVVLFQDITEVVRLQDERDRLLQLAAVGEILPSLLHELRNPVASVTTALEVLTEETHDEDLQKTLYAVLREMRRVRLGLQGIGTVGRTLQSDHFEAVDHALRETCRVMLGPAQEAGVRVVARVDDLPLLPFDATVVRGLLYNLLNNAIAACRGFGDVAVLASLDEGGRSLRVTVKDTGRGMTPEVLARCTELFYTTKPRGSGIGLALCQRTIEEAGGRLEIESRPDDGTTVVMHLPVRSRKPRRGSSGPPGRETTRTWRNG